MKSLVNTQKQEQFKKFMAKDSSFLKKIVGGGDGEDKINYPNDKIKI